MQQSRLILLLCLFFTFKVSAQITWDESSGPNGGLIQQISSYNGDYYAISARTLYKSYFSKTIQIGWNKFEVKEFTPSKLILENDSLLFGISSSIDASSHNILFRSKDKLQTWVMSSTGLEKRIISDLKFQTNGDIFAMTDDGVYISKDNGYNWSKGFNISSLQYGISFLCVNKDGTYFGGSFYGLYKSEDKGKTWLAIDNSSNSFNFNLQNIYIDSLDNLFVLTTKGLFRSSDNAKTWTLLNNGLPTSNLNLVKFLQMNQILVSSTSIDSTYFTSDNGNSWSMIAGYGGIDIALSSDGSLCMATNSGVVYSAKGISGNSITGPWSYRNTGINEVAISSILVDSSTNNIFVGDDKGRIHRSTDNGNSWQLIYNTKGAGVSALKISLNGNFFSSSIWGGVDRSTDGGETWVKKSVGLNDPDVRDIAIDNDGNIYAATFSILFKSTDNGDTWKSCYAESGSMECNSLTVNSKNTLFLSSYGSGLVKSTDEGKTWTKINTGLSATTVVVKTAPNRDMLTLTNQGYLYKSTNEGKNWVALNKSQIFNQIFPFKNNQYFATVYLDSTHLGLFNSTDNGLSWINQSVGLNGLYPLTLESKKDGVLFLGTTEGFYRSHSSVLEVESDTQQSNISFILYPNPVQTSLNLNGNKITDEKYIVIYNIFGMEVFRTEFRNDLDLSNLESGLYYLKVGQEIQKFIKCK